MNQEAQRAVADQCDRRQILAGIIGELHQVWCNGQCAVRGYHQRVAISGCACRQFTGYAAACAMAIVHHGLLAHQLGQARGVDACHDICGAADGLGYQQPNRT